MALAILKTMLAYSLPNSLELMRYMRVNSRFYFMKIFCYMRMLLSVIFKLQTINFENIFDSKAT